MDDISKKRQELLRMYRSPRTGKINTAWADKVKKMSDSQVIAVNMRLKREGKI